jgi:molybdopterin-guanine dinucleotide biosynthesis protein A
MTIEPRPATLGLVLAGGLARRMGGGDKIMLRIGGATILERVLERFRPQCAAIVLNANGDPARFASTGLPVVPDSIPDFAGPLAGILAGLDWAAENAPDIEWIASVPGDGPFLPRDLVARLHDTRIAGGKPFACARSGDWRHPVVGVWPVALRADLRHALVEEDLHNVNTPDEAAAAERIAQQYPQA